MKVIRIKLINETEIEKVRDYIYEQKTYGNSKSYYKTDDIIGLFYEEEYITRYTIRDCLTYKQIKQQRKDSRGIDGDNQSMSNGRGDTRENKDNEIDRGQRLIRKAPTK